MKIVEGRVRIGDGNGPGAFASVEAFVGELAEVAESTDSVVQAFDGRYVAGREHLQSAVDHARRAIDRGENVADDPAVEILLYAAGRRQIDQAMEMGVDTGEGTVIVVLDGGDEAAGAEAVARLLDDGPVEPDPDRIRSYFSITDAELEATDADLETLVCERVALLDVEK